MPNFNNSPAMNLPIPIVGQDPGPNYATDVNSCFTLIDQHTHQAGSGVPITPDAININTALDFQSNFGINLAGLTLVTQGVTPAINTIYESGVDLYFVDGVGNNIRITQSGAVAGTPGSISNLTSPASASYVSASQTFVWQSAVSIAANMDMGSAIMRNLTLSSFGLTLSPPTLANDYTITLPQLPVAKSILEIDTSGTITATQPISTLVPTGGVIAFAGASAPTGWLMCDGSAVSRATYASLFATIGITAGQGDGTTTFNVPDYRGLFLRGVSGSSGIDPNANTRFAMNTGGNTGNNVSSGQDDATAINGLQIGDGGHHHVISTAGSGNQSGNPVSFVFSANSGSSQWVTDNSTSNISLAAGDQETRPVNAYVYYLIKT